MNEVKVGELYRLSQGRRGYPPGAYTLTERLIYDNSIDPPRSRSRVPDRGDQRELPFREETIGSDSGL